MVPRLAARDVDGAAVHEDAEPGAHGGASGVEARRGAPEVEERVLHGLVGERRIPQHLDGAMPAEARVAVVQLGQSRLVALGAALISSRSPNFVLFCPYDL